MTLTDIITAPAIYITLAAIFIPLENANAQTRNNVCKISFQQTENCVRFLTPASDKIIFSKIINEGEPAFTMQLQAFGSEIDPGKGVHIFFTNGNEIELPDLSINIGIPDTYKVAFKYTGTVSLTYVQMEYMKRYPVKEYTLGNIKCMLSKTEQSRFLNYFNCLLKESAPASLTTNQQTSTW